MYLKHIKKIPLLLLLICTGCANSTNDTTTEVWEEIEGIHFVAANVLGESIYCYEDDSDYYCDFWLSGSGVPAIFFYTSPVEFESDGTITVTAPVVMSGGKEQDFEAIETVTIQFQEGSIFLNEIEYKNIGLQSRDTAFKWYYQRD